MTFFHFITEQRMHGSSGVKRNADHLPGILSRGRPEKRGQASGKTGQVSASSDPVAFFFKSADLIRLLEKQLDVKSLQRLASVNRRLRDVLGQHHDLEFMQQHWAPHRRYLNEHRRMYGNATRGVDIESGFDEAIRNELIAFFEHYQPRRDIARVLQFVYGPAGPQHAHARRFIEEHIPFLLVSTMHTWTRTMRIFYYEEFMWQACLAANTVESAIAGERFLEMVTVLEEMAHKDGKHTFNWTSERLARSMLSVRRQFACLRDHCRQSPVLVPEADLATRTIDWIDARVPRSREYDLLPPGVGAGVVHIGAVYARLAMPHEHVIAGNIVNND